MSDYIIYDDDEDIDYSDIPEVEDEFFASAVVYPGIKVSHVTVIVDVENSQNKDGLKTDTA